MPSKSGKQRRYMAGCCKNPKSMGKCPPKSVSCEYMNADKSRSSPKPKPAKKQSQKRTQKRSGKK